ncbi:MAG: segregation/condensation protein A, partial [Pyrinomonadaceae bacterium]|nr:segregation/condensation protein A [Pyrinomonadaceae bacterium]
EEEFEDPRQELVDRLLEYEKFKSAAGMLHERGEIEQATFTRGAIETDDDIGEVDATVFDLLKIFQQIAARHIDEVKMEIGREEISLADMIKSLKRRIFDDGELSLLKFFDEIHTRREIVTAFIAVLEIVRTESVTLLQKQTFGDVILRRMNQTG